MTTSTFISKHPLAPSQREEISALLADIAQYPLLSREEEYNLAVRSLNGDKAARDRLINSNLRLVVAIAKSVKTNGILSFSDLIQEGAVGLTLAAKRYDPIEHPGVRFASFAGTLIRHAVADALGEQSDSFSLPANVYAARKRLWRAADTFLAEHGCEATESELARLTGFTVAQVRAAQLGMASTASLDDAESPVDVPADEDVEQDATDAATWDEVKEILSLVLTPRERLVILMHYGLGDTHAKPKTLLQVGRAMGLSREAARLLELSALDKLRAAYETGKRPQFHQLLLLAEDDAA